MSNAGVGQRVCVDAAEPASRLPRRLSDAARRAA